jgi:hypothetical protein
LIQFNFGGNAAGTFAQTAYPSMVGRGGGHHHGKVQNTVHSFNEPQHTTFGAVDAGGDLS